MTGPVERPGSPRVPDKGVQAERTALAWQRTALVLAATSAAVLRLVAYRAGAGGMLACGLVVIAAVLIMRVTRQRYRRSTDAVRWDVERREGAAPAMPGARLPAVVAAAVIVLGSVEILAVVVGSTA